MIINVFGTYLYTITWKYCVRVSSCIDVYSKSVEWNGYLEVPVWVLKSPCVRFYIDDVYRKSVEWNGCLKVPILMMCIAKVHCGWLIQTVKQQTFIQHYSTHRHSHFNTHTHLSTMITYLITIFSKFVFDKLAKRRIHLCCRL